jgi:lysophospholipase L1-like esterase
MGVGRVAGLLAAAEGYRRWRARQRRLNEVAEDFAGYWHRRARRPGELCFVALGDSLAQGLTASRPERGFVGLLADGLARSSGCEVGVLNLSVTGATVADVLAGQLPRLAGLDPVLITVCVGTNDVTRTPAARFGAQFRGLCFALAAAAPRARVLVADIPDFRRGPHRAAAEQYSAVCRAVIAEYPRLSLVALQRATRDMRIWELGPDLVHPGNAGHRRYFAAFAAALGLGVPVAKTREGEPGAGPTRPHGSSCGVVDRRDQ